MNPNLRSPSPWSLAALLALTPGCFFIGFVDGYVDGRQAKRSRDADGGTGVECSTSAGNGGCICTVGSRPNDFACNRSTVENSICCATSGWPKAGSKCECMPFVCETNSWGTCECSLGQGYGINGNASSCYPPSGGDCCKTPDNTTSDCDCRTASYCEYNETSVSSCSVDVMDCNAYGYGYSEVYSCTE